MVDNNNLDKVLDKIKKIIAIKKFDDADDDDELLLWYGWPTKDV